MRGGLIPARAGNTVVSGDGLLASWAHPRSRGEHFLSFFVRSMFLGSSPLARGTLLDFVHRIQRWGLIPARAGNTHCIFAGQMVFRAHPRSRGEHLSRPRAARSRMGSSPLARGTLTQTTRPEAGVGLIPARAGNTPRHRAAERASWAHPRSRGEHSPPCGHEFAA